MNKTVNEKFLKLSKILFCKHEQQDFIRNISGDEINHVSTFSHIYRSEWKCSKCGRRIYHEELNYNICKN